MSCQVERVKFRLGGNRMKIIYIIFKTDNSILNIFLEVLILFLNES